MACDLKPDTHMKTFCQNWNLVNLNKHILPLFLLLLFSCNKPEEDIPSSKILKAKPIQKIHEENVKEKITPPDTISLQKDSLQQMSKDTTETMEQAPKRPATMPKKYFKLNIHKRPMITLDFRKVY